MLKINFNSNEEIQEILNQYKGYFIHHIAYHFDENYILISQEEPQEVIEENAINKLNELEERVNLLENVTNDFILGGI